MSSSESSSSSALARAGRFGVASLMAQAALVAAAAGTAKAGTEDGHELFGHSIIVNPQGEIMAQATSWGDELIVAEADLGMCELGRTTIFNFAKHRRPEAYGRITDQVGSEPPKVWTPGG